MFENIDREKIKQYIIACDEKEIVIKIDKLLKEIIELIKQDVELGSKILEIPYKDSVISTVSATMRMFLMNIAIEFGKDILNDVLNLFLFEMTIGRYLRDHIASEVRELIESLKDDEDIRDLIKKYEGGDL